mgnify:CR=1 FL=1
MSSIIISITIHMIILGNPPFPYNQDALSKETSREKYHSCMGTRFGKKPPFGNLGLILAIFPCRILFGVPEKLRNSQKHLRKWN